MLYKMGYEHYSPLITSGVIPMGWVEQQQLEGREPFFTDEGWGFLGILFNKSTTLLFCKVLSLS